MFIWRVAVNALPIRENLQSRINILDPCCVLCNQEVESASHLFLRCPIAKALWFSTCWGFKPDGIQAVSPTDIIKIILDPPRELCQAQDLWMVTLTMALTLEEIWRSRNVVLHQNEPIDLLASTQSIHMKIMECTRVFACSEAPSPRSAITKWSPPPPGTIKLNVDVAIAHSKAALAVIARNEAGAVIKIWTKIIPKSFPLRAEVEAILWALQVLRGNNGDISVLKVTLSSASTQSWIAQAALYGLSLRWCLIFVCLLSLSFHVLFFGFVEVEMLLLMR